MTTGVTAVPLRRNREFQLLWVGQALSDFGSALSGLALPLMLLAAGYAPAQVGPIGTIILVVALAVRMPASYLADRYDQRALMRRCDLLRLVVVAAVAALVFFRPLPIVVAIGMAVVSSAALEVYRPSQAKLLRRVVPTERLGQAVSLNQARSFGSGIVAPAVSGLLLAVASWLPFALDALTFGLSALTVTMLPRGRAAGAPARGERFLARLAAGWRHVARDRFLRGSSAYFAVLNLVFSALTTTLILGIATTGGPAAVGFALSAAAVAGLAGSLLAPRIARRMSLRTVLAVGPAVATALLATSWLGAGAGPVVAAFAALCLMTPVIGVIIATVLATTVPADIYGRVTAATSFAPQLLQPLGPLAAGFLLTRMSLGATAGLFAAVLGALAAFALALPAPESVEVQEAQPC